MTCSTAAIAQSIGAGQQLQQIPPAPLIPKATPDIDLQPRAPAPLPELSGEAIRIDALRITGATLFPPEALLAASGFVPGSTLTLGEMRSVAGRISA